MYKNNALWILETYLKWNIILKEIRKFLGCIGKNDLYKNLLEK